MSGPTGESNQGEEAAASAGSAPRTRWVSFRGKVVLVTVGTGVLVGGLLIACFAVQLPGVMAQQLSARGQTAAVGLAGSVSFALLSGNEEGLARAAETALAEMPDVAYVVVRDPSGKLLAEAIRPELMLARLSSAEIPALPLAPRARTAERMVELRGTSLLAVEAPVLAVQQPRAPAEEAPLEPDALVERLPRPRSAERKVIGVVQVGLRTGSSQATIAAITRRATLLGSAAMAGGALLAYFLARMLTVPVERLTLAAAGIARGDLEQGIHTKGSDEIAQLAWSFETMTSGLKEMIADLRSASADVEGEASRILVNSSRQTVVASQQSQAINETRSTANEIARASRTATGYADSMIKTAQQSEDLSLEGQRVVHESVGGIERLGDQVASLASEIEALAGRTRRIVEIIGTVKEVAERSHVLSLNLSIQASQAGPNRHGFDVVATEMRKLAALSGVAASEVRAIVEEIQRSVEGALRAAREGIQAATDTVWLSQTAGRSISALAEVIRESSRAAREIGDHTRRQTADIDQILNAINEQSEAMEAAVHGSEQVVNVAENLTTLAKRLSGMVGRYSVRDPRSGA